MRIHRTPWGSAGFLASSPLLAVLVSLLFTPGGLAAQGTQFSVIGGATFSELRGIDGLDRRTGAMGGISLLFPFAGPLAFQPEALVTSRGANSGSGLLDDAQAVELSSFQLPLLLRLSLAPRSTFTPHVYVGPYLAFEIDCTLEGTSTSCDEREDISTKTVDVGGIAGAGVSMGFGPLILTGGLRYGFGLTALAEVGEAEFRESARHGGYDLYVGAGLRFGGR